jgi:hypothetical protein
MPIARRDLDLALIASRQPDDSMLDRLIRLADLPGVRIGLPVTLLVGGRFIEGNLGSSEECAELADEAVNAAFDQGEKAGTVGWTPDQWDVARKAFEKVDFKTMVARRRERDERDREEWEDTGSAWMDEVVARRGELSQKHIRRAASRPAFTLVNAVVETATGQRVEVGTIRVVTTHVAAWWIGRT